MALLSVREQEIFDHLWKNANFCVNDLDGRKGIESKQVKALAKAVAVELAGLERKLKGEEVWP